MPVPTHSFDNTISQLKAYKETTPELTEILTCYEKIFKAQHETKNLFQPDAADVDFAACTKKHADGLPFLNIKNISIRWDFFDSLAKQIADITKPLAKSGEKEVETFLEILSENPDTLHKASLHFVFGDTSILEELEKQHPVSRSTLSFIAIQSFIPFFEKYAQPLREYIDSSIWQKGTCPVCGGEPLMARLAEESGKKHLQCYLCRTNWEFGRLECAHCNTSDQKKLHYFYDEGNKNRRIELCDECKGYLKVIDTREKGALLSLVVENLATLELDIAAKREGFSRDTNRLFGL